jgi:hypothetical protein
MPNFNDAGPQRSFDVMPAGTVAILQLNVRPGNAGEGGFLRRAKDGNSEALDCEFTMVDGPFAKRKFWGLFTLNGTTANHAAAAEISRARLRAILESARGIRPDDSSEGAKQARQVASYGEFDGLRFIGRIGVEPAKDNFPAKNILLDAITPDRKDWHAVEQVGQHPATSVAPTIPATDRPEPHKLVRPQWAK